MLEGGSWTHTELARQYGGSAGDGQALKERGTAKTERHLLGRAGDARGRPKNLARSTQPHREDQRSIRPLLLPNSDPTLCNERSLGSMFL